MLAVHREEPRSSPGLLGELHFVSPHPLTSSRTTQSIFRDIRSIFPNSSCRPRFWPIYDEIPRYMATFSSFEYRCDSRPRIRKKPTPPVSSLASAFNLLPKVGRGKDSCETQSSDSPSSIAEEVSVCQHDDQIQRTKERIPAHTFELAASLLQLPNLRLVEY